MRSDVTEFGMLARWLGGSLSLMIAVGCGPTAPPAKVDARRPVHEAPFVEEVPAAKAQKALPSAMAVASPDAKLVGYIDFATLSGWSAEEGARWFVDEVIGDALDDDGALPCLSALVAKRPTVVFAAGPRVDDADSLTAPIMAVELEEHEPERVVACVGEAMAASFMKPIAGFPAVREAEHDWADALVATPRLLMAGEVEDLTQALQQVQRPHAATQSGLAAELPLDDDVVFAFAMRDFRELDKIDGAIRRRGEVLEGRVALSLASLASADELERDLRKDLARTQGKLSSLFGGGHAITEMLLGVQLTRQGNVLNGEARFVGYDNIKADIVSKLAEQKLRNRHHEAMQTVGAIARGAQAAYEREMVAPDGVNAAHQLCKSAIDVPKGIPKADTYTPDATAGRDFETGDDKRGWRCLKFSATHPVRYRYAYRQGGNYLGPKRGGPDPGPTGFEASAEGDLDGDGKTSFFSIVGVIDPKTKELTRGQLFMLDEHE